MSPAFSLFWVNLLLLSRLFHYSCAQEEGEGGKGGRSLCSTATTTDSVIPTTCVGSSCASELVTQEEFNQLLRREERGKETFYSGAINMNDELHSLRKQNEEMKLKLEEYKRKIDEFEVRTTTGFLLFTYTLTLFHQMQERALVHSTPCNDDVSTLMIGKEEDSDITHKALSIIVLGASGDLAKKKTYPALYSLYLNNMLPHHAQLIGFARSDLQLEPFRDQIKKRYSANNFFIFILRHTSMLTNPLHP